MSLGTRFKDPDEIRLFTFDWSRHLGTDTIDTFTITIVPNGAGSLTNDEAALVDGNQKVSVLLSGGVPNVKYTITNQIVTASGETLERTGVVAVRQM